MNEFQFVSKSDSVDCTENVNRKMQYFRWQKEPTVAILSCSVRRIQNRFFISRADGVW